jgi:hypothetical protein
VGDFACADEQDNKLFGIGNQTTRRVCLHKSNPDADCRCWNCNGDKKMKTMTLGTVTMPSRSADTMSDAIAMSSPSGRMSKRARAAAEERLRVALFGEHGLQRMECPQEAERDNLLRRAKQLRGLADRGMKPRAYLKGAQKLEALANLVRGQEGAKS